MKLVAGNCNWRKPNRNFAKKDTPINSIRLITHRYFYTKYQTQSPNYLFQICQRGLMTAARRTRLKAATVIYSSTRWRFITIPSVVVTTSSCFAIPTTATRRQRKRTSGIARTKQWRLSRIRNPGSVSSRNILFWTSTVGRSVGPRMASRAHKVPITVASALIRWSVVRLSKPTTGPASTPAWRSRGPTPRWCPRNGSSRWVIEAYIMKSEGDTISNSESIFLR